MQNWACLGASFNHGFVTLTGSDQLKADVTGLSVLFHSHRNHGIDENSSAVSETQKAELPLWQSGTRLKLHWVPRGRRGMPWRLRGEEAGRGDRIERDGSPAPGSTRPPAPRERGGRGRQCGDTSCGRERPAGREWAPLRPERAAV